MGKDSLAPRYLIKVQNHDLDVGVTGLISTVDWEFGDGYQDAMKVRVANPNSQISDSRTFQPGNELALWMGYGPKLEYIGAAVISKLEADFPENGEPTLSVVAYSRDHQMNDNEAPEATRRPGSKKKGQGGRAFEDSTYADAVRLRAADYLFTPDVDDTPDAPSSFVQTAGMSDYEFVRGCANITGYYFWVDRNAQGRWILHFKEPAAYQALQTKQYTFHYGVPNATLFGFKPALKYTGTTTSLVVHAKDITTGELMRVEIEEGKVGPPSDYLGDPKAKIAEPPPSGGSVKLFIGDTSVSVRSTKRFINRQELAIWALRWFERNRDNFILGSGRTIGLEVLRARQRHLVKGCGTLFDGEYIFDRVKHVMDSEGGYICDFSCHRVLPKTATNV